MSTKISNTCMCIHSLETGTLVNLKEVTMEIRLFECLKLGSPESLEWPKLGNKYKNNSDGI